MLHSDALILIERIKQLGYKSNDLENKFMVSIENSPFPSLTYKQAKWLNSIYDKSSGVGIYHRKQP